MTKMSPRKAFDKLQEEANQIINAGQHIYHDIVAIREASYKQCSIHEQKEVMQSMATVYPLLKAYRAKLNKIASKIYQYASYKFRIRGLNPKAMQELQKAMENVSGSKREIY